MLKDNLLTILKSELLLTIGCTDPASIAYAAAAAGSLRNDRSIETIEILLDKNILKNAQSVLIPGTGKNGIALAAALGIVKNKVDDGVLIFNHLTDTHIVEAEKLIGEVPVKISCNSSADHIYVEVKIYYDRENYSSSLIEYRHDNLKYIKGNDQFMYNNSDFEEVVQTRDSDFSVPEIGELIELISSISEEELSFLDNPRDTNLLVAQAGLTLNAGSGIGTWLKNLYEDEGSKSWPSIIMRSRYKVAAATDSRMGGVDIPVIACGGSGNHGLTYFITLNEVIDGSGYRKCAALGLAVLHYIKEATGILTPMCGCAMAAGMAASAALTFYFGGDEISIIRSMNYVLGSLGGVVCEGAKKECSLKTSLSSQIAIESSLLSMNSTKIDGGAGLFSDSLKGILVNLELIHKKGMKGFDEVMVEILLNKNYKIDNQI
jgi:L-cysteine desulfidase